MASYFGSTSNPVDNAGHTDHDQSITPVASMQPGDLVVLFAVARTNVSTRSITITNTGGQNWQTLGGWYITNNLGKVFFCTYNGVWSGNPTVNFDDSVVAVPTTSLIMHVFRPLATNKVWKVDLAYSTQTFAAGVSPTTINSVTPTKDNNVTVGFFTCESDNRQWSVVSGTNWSNMGTQNYRNTDSFGFNISFSRQIQSTPAATNNASKTQNTTAIQSLSGRFTLYEDLAPSYQILN